MNFSTRFVPGFFAGKVVQVRLMVAAMAALLSGHAVAASYTSSSASDFSWTTTSAWTPAPGASGPASGDTATLSDVSAARTVTYDATATGALGVLNIIETSGFSNTLKLARSLNVASDISLSGAGATLDLQNFVLTNGNLTVGGGGSLLIGSNGQTTAVNSITGNLILNAGGAISTNANAGDGGSNKAPTVSVTGSVTMNGGTLTLNQSSTGGLRFQSNGNFTGNGGSVVFSGSGGTNAALTLSGAVNVFGSGMTFSTINGATSNNVFLLTSANLNQSLTIGTSAVLDLAIRQTGSGNSSVKTVTSTAAGNYIGTVLVGATGNASSSSTFKMGSDLVVSSGKNLFGLAAGTNLGTLGIDLNGHTYDGTSYAAGWKPSNNGSTDNWALTSSGGAGVFKATLFDFSTTSLRISVGSNVTLQATGTGANVFTPSGTVVFDPNSTFYYTGSGATLANVGGTMGNIVVGTGSSASTLTLNSAVSVAAASTVRVASQSTLVLGSNALSTGTGKITIESGGSLNTSGITQSLLDQISSSSGSAPSAAYLNLTASVTLNSALDFSNLGNVSLGGSATISAGTGSLTPSNGSYKLGSPLGTLTIAGSILSGASNNLIVTGGNVRIGSSNATFGGDTVIEESGRLTQTTATRLPSTTNMTNNGIFDLVNTDTGANATIASLSGAGVVTNTASSDTYSKTLIVNGSRSTTFSGQITDAASSAGATLGLTKSGSSILTLSGTLTYAGSTSVNGGTLLINGNAAGASGAVTVRNTGSLLGGSGIIGGATTFLAGSKLSAGQSAGAIGTLTFSNGLDLSAASDNSGAYLFDLGLTGSSDKIAITSGVLNVGVLDAADFVFTTSTGFGNGIYKLFDASNSISGSIGSSLVDLGGGFTGTLSIDNVNNDILLTVVPEPAPPCLMVLGCLMMAAWVRRRMLAR